MTAHRRSRLRGLLTQHELDALLVTSLVNVRYLTGFTGSYAHLLVTADGRDVLVTDGRYRQQATTEAPDVDLLVVPPGGWLADAVGQRRLGLEAHAISWAQAERVGAAAKGTVVAAAPLVEQLRQVKDAQEIAALRRACEVADQAFSTLLQRLQAGTTEQQIAVLLERAMVDAGADDPAFDTIVATGPHTAIPHHQPTDRPLGRNDLIKVDFGARVDGYHSDMTRMASIGSPASRLQEVFTVVRAAQEAGLRAAHDGAATGQVDAACRDVIAAAGFGDCFVHGTGHGIGLQIHEDPFLRPVTATPGLTAAPSVTLRAGMTVTVEPGVYLPGVGGVRIEDSLVITPTGPDVLTHTPKDLVVL